MKLSTNSKLKRVTKYVTDCYERLDPKIRDSVFRGGENQMATVLTSFAAICGGNYRLEDSTREDVVKLLSVYIYIVLNSIAGTSKDEVVSYLCNNYNEYVIDEQHGRAMYSFAILNHKNPDFSVYDKNNMSLVLNETLNDSVSQKETTKKESMSNVKRDEFEAEKDYLGYYFANQKEFIIFVSIEKPTKKVVWLSGDNYSNEFLEGYRLVDQNNLNNAIKHFNKAISWNPIAIDARFELVNCYLRLKDYNNAIGSLRYLEKYLADKKDIARYYRTYGYYFVEQHDYERGAASYILSLEYEKSVVAINEMAAIIKRYNIDLTNKNIKTIVSSGRAKLLEPWYKQDEQNMKDTKKIEDGNKSEVKETDDLRCPSCKRILPKDSEFCQYCGISIKVVENIKDLQREETNEAKKQSESVNLSATDVDIENKKIVEEEKKETEFQKNSINQDKTDCTDTNKENSEAHFVKPDMNDVQKMSTSFQTESEVEPSTNNTLNPSDNVEMVGGQDKEYLDKEVKENDNPEGHVSNHNDLRVQNKLLFAVIGLLLAIIALLVILLVKPQKEIESVADLSTAEVQATESEVQEPSSQAIEETSIDNEEEAQMLWPKAEPLSVEKLDPYGYLNEGEIFGSSISPYIYGLEAEKDFKVAELQSDKSVKLYTLFKKFEYFGLPKGHSGIDIYYRDGKGIDMMDYAFVLDPNDNEKIITLYRTIIDEIETNYGKTYDIARKIDINDNAETIIDEDIFVDNINNSISGEYDFYWFFSNYHVSLVLFYEPTTEFIRGFVGFANASE